MNVYLLGMTEPWNGSKETSDIAFTALSQCYNEKFSRDDAEKVEKEKKKNILKSVIKSGHESVIEHISFTFLIENVSRVCTHQLVRHRLASYTQRSGRYTGLESGDDWYVIPQSVSNNKEALKAYIKTMKDIKDLYTSMVEKYNIPAEDARFILPNGQHTNIVMTMNCRSLKNFFGLRLCSRAQWEIRELAVKMSRICKHELPEVFVDCKFGEPKCVQNGFCTEPITKYCHRMPHITELQRP